MGREERPPLTCPLHPPPPPPRPGVFLGKTALRWCRGRWAAEGAAEVWVWRMGRLRIFRENTNIPTIMDNYGSS